jgi:imidazolonepropionase-like amidohydrolase/ABC-type multidrug transport system permease subunit
MRPYLALFRSNLRLTLRERSVLFFNFIFPFIFFFGFAELFGAGKGEGIAYFVGTVLMIGILGNGLWGAGMRSVQEREANILRRFKVTPISPLPILAASMASGWLLYLPVLVTLLGLAHFQYAMPWPRHLISLFLMASLGVCAFRAIGLILASVANTMQEATVLIQVLYMPMLFLSGVTFPSAGLPVWAQTVAEFMPATYLVNAFQGIFFRNQGLLDNAAPIAALLVTLAMGLFLSVQLFRWEKEEKIRPQKKLSVVAVLAPFLLLGCFRAYSKEHIGENQALFRQLQRSGTFLIRGPRIFTGDGRVIENGAVLVHDGKIAEVFASGAAPDAASLQADAIEAAGKTLLPGFIDAHVHLGGPAGISTSNEDYDQQKTIPRAAAALLYSGVTAARSTGDGLDSSLKLRNQIASGAKLGAQLFACGPMFTAEGGHGTEYTKNLPVALRSTVEAQIVRTPKTVDEARRQVRELKQAGADGIKAILEAGWGDGMLFNRMDLLIARAVADEARLQGLPVAVHTGDARDVADALDIGAASIEHGSFRDELPNSLLAGLAAKGVYYDPTLAVAEAYSNFFAGRADSLNNTLVEQTVPGRLLKATRDFLASGKSYNEAKSSLFAHAFDQGRANLLRAWKAGVPLVMGTDAGNPLVFPGASMQHELALWVQAGIPAEVALQAATANAARLLRAESRIGAVRKGLDADLLLVDGNPLQDISAAERISLVMFKGERISRSKLFEQK